MKKLIVLLMVFAGQAFGQDFADITYKKLTFYNEAGTAVTAIASGDTLCSERVLLDANTFSWGMTTVSNADTMGLNLFYRFGAGTGAGIQGYYTQGGQTMSALQDSLRTLGAREGDATAVHLFIATDPITSWISTPNGNNAVSSRDSTRTQVYGNSASFANGWQWFQVVLVGQNFVQNNLGAAGAAKSLAIFNTNRLIRRGTMKAR